MNKEKKEEIINALEDKKEFEDLYKIYLKVWYKNNKAGKSRTMKLCPACYDEWVDNELEELRVSYRRYLKEAVLEDDAFDETATEDFWDFAVEEINDPIW